MRKYRSETVKLVDTVICNVCKREDDDPMELQEYLAIDFVGGYNSVFGDMNVYTADICQRCFKELLGSYLTDITEKECYE